jgi:hypothetical protein
MTLFFASCSCPLRQSGKHIPGCPMNSNCSFCGLSPRMCKIFNKCAGIAKTGKFFVQADEKRNEIKIRLSNNLRDLNAYLNRLINQDAVSESLQQKNRCIEGSLRCTCFQKNTSSDRSRRSRNNFGEAPQNLRYAKSGA